MCKLVMIDDNPMEHLIMQKMFNRLEIFQDAEHSLHGNVIMKSLYENRRNPENLPDIIFLDLNMPDYDGWLFLEEFKAIYVAFKKNIDIYIVTSSINKLDRLRSKSYPFVKDFYSKPVTSEQLERLYLAYKNIDRMAG